MTTPFERIPPVEDPDDLVDRAFSSASGAADTASGADSQRAQIGSAASAVAGAFGDLVEGFPSFDRLEGFDAAIADVAVDVDAVRSALGSVDWAADTVDDVAAEAQSEIAASDDTEEAIAARKRGLARIQSIVDEVRDDLATLREAREVLVRIPEVDEDAPTAVLAGAPNTGKSTVLGGLTRASPPVDDYPFTSQVLAMGHIEDDETHRRYQLLDTPGLLDRPLAERNEMEQQAVTAIDEVADLVVILVDPTESCGYDRDQQAAIAAELIEGTDAPHLVVATKRDLLDDAGAHDDGRRASDVDAVDDGSGASDVDAADDGSGASGVDAGAPEGADTDEAEGAGPPDDADTGDADDAALADEAVDLAIDARDDGDLARLRAAVVEALRGVAVAPSPGRDG